MTIELVKILTDITLWVEDWNARAVPTEDEFLAKLNELSVRLGGELKKQELPIIKKKKNG